MKIDKLKINYRKLTLKDIDILIDYRIMFLKELQKNHTNESALRNSLKEYFTKSIANNEFVAWVAEYNKEPLGFGGMVIQDIPGHFEFISGKQGYILSMYTIQEARGLGICSQLLQKLIEDGRSLGLGKITLHATGDGEGIYRKFGFKEGEWPYLELST